MTYRQILQGDLSILQMNNEELLNMVLEIIVIHDAPLTSHEIANEIDQEKFKVFAAVRKLCNVGIVSVVKMSPSSYYVNRHPTPIVLAKTLDAGVSEGLVRDFAVISSATVDASLTAASNNEVSTAEETRRAIKKRSSEEYLRATAANLVARTALAKIVEDARASLEERLGVWGSAPLSPHEKFTKHTIEGVISEGDRMLENLARLAKNKSNR